VCKRLEGAYFIAPYEGGGQYGSERVGDWHLAGQELACDAVPKAKDSTRMNMLLKSKYDKDSHDIDKWLSAVVTGDWDVRRDGGIIVKKILPVDIYWRQEI
jgi:hypothetical protein